MTRKISIVIFLPLILISLLGGCGTSEQSLQSVNKEAYIMDTLISVQVYAPDHEQAAKAAAAALGEFTRIDKLTDKFAAKNMSDPSVSDIYRVNRQAGVAPVKVSEDVIAMLLRSNYFAKKTNGAFDVSIGPVADCWGFGQKKQQVPQQAALHTALKLVDYRKVVINKQQQTVFLPVRGMALDLGGVAKGYATDCAVKKLKTMGIKHALINAGGNVFAIGAKPDGSPWRIGIQDPRSKQGIIGILSVKDTAVVTSGDYERYFIQNGVRYHHILDPTTGQPARGAIETTIIASNATDADILSTTTFVLGPQAGMKFIKQIGNIDAIFVNPQKAITYTPRLNGQIELTGEGGKTGANS